MRKAGKFGNENCKNIVKVSKGHGDSAKLDTFVPSMEAAKPGFKEVEKWSENALWSVSELHVGDEKQTGSNKSDMERVLKGFGACDAFVASRLNAPNGQVGGITFKSSDIALLI
ncbi:hypothetical protein ZEAMMB73_Zm00001d011207 [Zea mays]|uniref:Uncharacterized protein n=1 Tax=Zea mays TaxID=4577 RepID=A0A1D6FXS0_MAIZE|nr:hypothetical protein ZEAMMB73_Zm00001d011207 [Zea mays]